MMHAVAWLTLIVTLLQYTATAAAAFAFKSSYINLSGVKHHIRDTGEVVTSDSSSSDATPGPIAILLHGFTGSTDAWDQVAPLLAAGGCRAIAYDRVGFGRTERPTVPTLPSPPPLPFAEALANALLSGEPPPSSGGGFALPNARRALAIGVEDPKALAPRLPWQWTSVGEDPYSSKFAVSNALRALLEEIVGSTDRPVYLVGHSAAGPLALRALVESVESTTTKLAGVALLAPAALDLREDPDVFDYDEAAPGLFDNLPLSLPPDLQRRLELETRIAAFRGVLSLPDAFGLQTARRIAEGRDLEAAVRAQVHPRMSGPEFAGRVEELANKYASPLYEFPDEWDRGLLNVYRADANPNAEDRKQRGRKLLRAAKEAKKQSGARVLVATGDSDKVVTVRHSERVGELLDAERFETFNETGHLPMDERPEELAAMLLKFMAD